MAHIISERADGCARIRLSNTEANVLTHDCVLELSDAIRSAVNAEDAIMLCGGSRFFSNGLDVAWAMSRSPAQMREMFLALGALILQMLEAPIPIVGVIKGHAIGAAKTLLLACDHRIAARGRVLIGVPEIHLGVPNPWFADQLLRFVAGDTLASDLIYSGRLAPAEEFLSSLIHELADQADVEALAWTRTQTLAALPRAAFAECKSMRVTALCARIRGDLESRTDRLMEIWAGADAQARLAAAAQRLRK